MLVQSIAFLLFDGSIPNMLAESLARADVEAILQLGADEIRWLDPGKCDSVTSPHGQFIHTGIQPRPDRRDYA